MITLVKANIKMIARNKLHISLLIILYIFGYVIPYGIYWFDTDNNLISISLREELYIFAALPASVFGILNESYLKYDKDLFCTFSENVWKKVYSLCFSFYVIHMGLYLIGSSIFSALSYLMTGYINFSFIIIHDIVMGLQLASGIFFIFALIFLLKRSLYSYVIYGFLLIILSSMKNVYLIFPVTAYVTNTLGYYQNLDIKLWLSRIIQVVVCYIFFRIAYRKYMTAA